MQRHLATHKDRHRLRSAATALVVLGGVGLHLPAARAQSATSNCVSDADRPCDGHDDYHDDCGGSADRGLLVDDCDHQDRARGVTLWLVFGPVWGPKLPPFPTPPPSTVLTLAPWVPGSGSNLASQVRPAEPGPGTDSGDGRALVYEQIGLASDVRVDDFQFGAGAVGLIAHGAHGFLMQGSADFQRRFAWLNPYGGVAVGAGMVSYNRQAPESPGDTNCCYALVAYLAAHAGVRVFLTPNTAIGVDVQQALLGTQKLESMGLTLDLDIPEY
jgi:hypothetical protein